MKLELKRFQLTDETTIGRLYVDGVFQCYTLEDRSRENAPKVPGETCIPYGEYVVIINESPAFSKRAGRSILLPRLLDVPNFKGILIHTGTNKSHTDGCILVGETFGRNVIGESRAAFDKLFPKLKAAQDRKEKITITVSAE